MISRLTPEQKRLYKKIKSRRQKGLRWREIAVDLDFNSVQTVKSCFDRLRLKVLEYEKAARDKAA